MTLQLEVGKYYRNAMGDVYGPFVRSEDRNFPFTDKLSKKSWTSQGRVWLTSAGQDDLVAEVKIPTVTTNSTGEGRKDDPVNYPSHYTSGAIECLDAMQAMLSVEEFRGYLRGSVFKYQWRYRHKGGAQDLHKATFYLDRLCKLEAEQKDA